MKKCENCSKRFSYKDVFESILFTYRPLSCTSCNRVHNLELSTKIIIVLSIGLPFLILANLINTMGYYTIVFYLLWLVILFALLPFIASYKVEVKKLNIIKK